MHDPSQSPARLSPRYTVSLLLFIVPILIIAFWFVPQEGVKIEKKNFLWTIGLLFPVGAGLTSSSPDTSSPFPTSAQT